MPSKPALKPTGTPETSVQPSVATSAFPPLPPSTSSATSLQSPLAKNTPKTLRVLPTPKTETPNAAGITTPSSATSMFPPTFPPSRQPSLASTSRLERPGTPASEIISDNASITSASMSRASSPPPSKIGSAPVRSTTKSMQKKQRKEVQKEKEKSEIESVASKPEPEVEIAPIMGRKKKQKKERPVNSANGGSTPAASRPPSPGPEEPEEKKSPSELVEPTVSIPDKPALIEQESNKSMDRAPDLKSKGKGKTVQPMSPEPVSNIAEDEPELAEKPIPTPASILQELISSGDIQDAANLNILKHPSISFRNQDQPLDIQNANHKLTITPEDRAALLSGLPVHKVVEGPNRIMLTPNGDCVRNLTPEEEARYLELQARITQEAGPTAFFSAKHHASNGFTLVGGRAVPNGPPSFFPLANGNATPMDPVSKIQRDEALSYINQYVLPSLSTNSQLEKALNANALDAEMLRSGDSSTWSSWGNDAGTPQAENSEGAYGAHHHHEGILASGLESMTAHFAVGRDIDRGQPLGNVSLLSQSEAESALQMARKETESLEKKLNLLLKKNRRLLLGTVH